MHSDSDPRLVREARAAELRQMVEEARKDSRLTPADEVFGRLEAKYKRRQKPS